MTASVSTEHTFLFSEGLWLAEGLCGDQYGQERPCRGSTRIIHEESLWILEGVVSVAGAPDGEFKNRYEIVPFPQEEDFTTWKSVSATLGLLHGVFAVVADCILSRFISGCGNFIGVETMRFVSPEAYAVRGMLFYRDEKLSSWAMDLRRAE